VWVGRMSPEKRLLPFLDALADSGVAADVTVIGGGGQARAGDDDFRELGGGGRGNVLEHASVTIPD